MSLAAFHASSAEDVLEMFLGLDANKAQARPGSRVGFRCLCVLGLLRPGRAKLPTAQTFSVVCCFGRLKGGSKSVQLLLNGMEAVMVLTLITLKQRAVLKVQDVTVTY